jgi:hypothetical protein
MNRTLTLCPNDWSPNIETAIAGGVRTYATKTRALSAGKAFGWRSAVRIQRRFERVWVVGAVDFQPTTHQGESVECLRIPLLRWDRDERGIEFCPVLVLRRPYTSA